MLSPIQKKAFASGSYKNLIVQWRSFLSFCNHYSLDWQASCPRLISWYAIFLSGSMRSQLTVANYLRGVKSLFVLLERDVSHFDSIMVRMTLKGLSRVFPHCPRRALPLTPSILIRIRSHLDFNVTDHVVFWSMLLLGFFTMARKSNLMLSSGVKEGTVPLRRSHVRYRDGNLVVYFVWSKTNQFAKRVHCVPVAAIPGSPLCPVTAYLDMVRRVPAPLASLAFVCFSGGKMIPVTYAKFQSFLRQCLSRSGLPAHRYSSHSMRRGGATHAFRCGVPGELIQLHGDWSSDAYKLYLNFSLDQKLSVSNMMSSNLFCV